MFIRSLLAELAVTALEQLPNRTFHRNVTDPYLRRFSVFRRRWLAERWPDIGPFAEKWLPSVHPHYFYRGDEDVELHNHPWDFTFSIIITNGYHEVRRVFGTTGDIVMQHRELRPGMVNVIRKNDFHKVALRDPSRGCWTLFFAWRKTQDWGFWHPETGQFLFEGEHRARAIARAAGAAAAQAQA